MQASSSVFGPPVMVNNDKKNDQAAPVSVVVAGQELYVVWQDARSGSEDIYSSMSYDDGTTFLPNKRADDSIGLSKQIEPSTAVSRNGTILLAWQDNRRSTFDFDVFFTKSYDGGTSYAKNTKVDDSGADLSWQERPSIAVTESGSICVAWTDDRSGLMRVRYTYSTNDGGTFAPSKDIVPLNGTSGQTDVILASNGDRVFAAFTDNVTGTPHLYMCVSTDGGKTFGAPFRLDNTGDGGSLQNGLSVAPMPGGGVVVAWQDNRNGNWDIYASIVSADGSVSASNVRVDDDTTGEIQRDPCVASDQLGNVYVVWEDDRNLKFAIRFAYLEASRTGFSASVEVSSPGQNDMQRRPSIVSTVPGRVFVFWQDDKTGSYDVYSSTANFPNLFGISLVKGWNFVALPAIGFNCTASTLGLMTGDIVTSWNPATQTYDKTYIVGVSPPFVDFPIENSTGYWILAKADERILLNGTVPTAVQQRHVVVPSGGGWVVVGFQSLNVTRYASDVPEMYSTAGSISLVVSYNPATGTYKLYRTGLPFTDFPLVPGQAIWCLCSANGTLTYAP